MTRLRDRLSALKTELAQLRQANADALETAESICAHWRARAERAEAALELALRDNARLVDDREDAENWRRYVAMAGPKRASLYLVPPDNKEEEH